MEKKGPVFSGKRRHLFLVDVTKQTGGLHAAIKA